MGLSDTKKGKAAKSLLEALLALAAIGLVEWFLFGFHKIDLHVPVMTYWDSLTAVSGIKGRLSSGTGPLGWPFYEDLSSYGFLYGQVDRLLCQILHLFCRDTGAFYNLYLFSIPLANAFVAYLVLRHFNIRRWLAFLASICFGACPYVQYRFTIHLGLARIECIPIVIMLCLWCLEDPAFNRPGKGWARYKRNWIGLALALLIADNGMVYYPFFSCFVFLVTALYLLCKGRRLRAALPALLLVAEVAGALLLLVSPAIVGTLLGVGDMLTNGGVRVPGNALRYALSLQSLLLSPRGYGLPFLAGPIADLIALASSVSNSGTWVENNYGYMGIAGALGLLFLCGHLLFARQPSGKGGRLGGRLRLLSCIAVACVLLGVQSGIGIIVNLVIPYIRCYNRISPFLVFCGVFALALGAERVLARYGSAHPGGKKGLALLSCVAAVFFAYALVEQAGIYYDTTDAGIQAREAAYAADEAFVGAIEESAGAGGMVFQLPYMSSFENGFTNDIVDYDHLRGKIHSGTLRWSYGAATGSKNDVWYKETASLATSPLALVDALYGQGFAGIWLNRDGYDTQAGWWIEQELCAAAHCDGPIRCADGHTVYIPLSSTLRYHYDRATRQVTQIDYTATRANAQAIRAELYGDGPSLAFLERALQDNGYGGGACSVAVPTGCALFYATVCERSCYAAATVVDARDVRLAPENGVLWQAARYPLTIKEGTVYRVDLTLAPGTDTTSLPAVSLGLYGGEGYGGDGQERTGILRSGAYRYTYYIYSGEFTGETLEGQFRLFTYDRDAEVNFSRVTVTEMALDKAESCTPIGATQAFAGELEPAEEGTLQLANFRAGITANTTYEVRLDLSRDSELGALDDLVFDLCGRGYNNAAQEVGHFVRPGQYSYTFYLDSGEREMESAGAVPLLWYRDLVRDDRWSAWARVFTRNTGARVGVGSLRITAVRRVSNLDGLLRLR